MSDHPISTFEVAQPKTTVWKYTLDLIDGPQRLDMPRNPNIVHVAMQHGRLCLWAHVDPRMDKRPVYFEVHGTGHPIAGAAYHVGIAFQGALVWHVFSVHP